MDLVHRGSRFSLTYLCQRKTFNNSSSESCIQLSWGFLGEECQFNFVKKLTLCCTVIDNIIFLIAYRFAAMLVDACLQAMLVDACLQAIASRCMPASNCQQMHACKQLPVDACLQAIASRCMPASNCQQMHTCKQLPVDAYLQAMLVDACLQAIASRCMPASNCQQMHTCKQLPVGACLQAIKQYLFSVSNGIGSLLQSQFVISCIVTEEGKKIEEKRKGVCVCVCVCKGGK